ncbi:MAG TPA: alpha/beta hydrolase [Spirochaetota bacterium]|nr:alpha/beta hydrolase [Spirochaetota bacterium]
MRKNQLTTSSRWGTLSYRRQGDFQGPAIIMIHGAVGDSRLYRYQLRHFGHRFKTIALDLPGHGSSYNGVRPTLDDFIRAIEDIITEERISSFILIGHSMGGGVCLEACRRRIPGLVAMVLVSTSAILPVSKGLVDIVERDDMNALADLIVGAVFSRKVEILIGFARKGLHEMDRNVIRTDVEICKDMDYTATLADIDIPVLVIANRRDLVIGCDLTVALASGIRNSRMVVFDQDGHVPFFENPAGFNEAVDAFLDDCLI